MALPARSELDPMEDVLVQDDLGRTIADHTFQCGYLFEKYMAVPKIMPDPTLMDDQLARFTLWASNMDVFGPLNVSLDCRLRYSPEVVKIIHQLLDVICNSLTSLKPFDDPPQAPITGKLRTSETGNAEATKRVAEDSCDMDSDVNQAQKNVSLVTYTIGESVTRLFRLSNAIRKSAEASRTHKLGEYSDDEEANNAIAELRLYTECYIRFRFPQAPEALRSALVEANALRLRRLNYQRSHRRRAASSVQRPQADPQRVQLPEIPDSTSAEHRASSVTLEPEAMDEGLEPTSLPSAPTTVPPEPEAMDEGSEPTSFPSAPISVPLEPEAMDEGLEPTSLPSAPISVPLEPEAMDEGSETTGGPSAPTSNASTASQNAVRALYADSTWEVPRAKSALVNNSLSFAPVPTTSECPYCGVIVEFKDTAKPIIWKNHVIRDLEPFICVYAHCTDLSQQEPVLLTFETSKAWMSHMQNAHKYAWECRAPSHDPIIFDKEVEFQEHSRKEHGVPNAYVGTLSGAARRPVFEKILECPFGDKFSAPEKAGSNTYFSNEVLYLHIAAHMIEIAFLALQKLPSNDDDKSEDVASDQPSGGDWLDGVRGSMYSVPIDEAPDFPGGAENGVSNIFEEDISFSVNRLDLEDKDAAGMTKLHRAVRDNNLPLARSLVDQGANLHSRASQGKTALHYAASNRSESVDMMILLLGSGAGEIMNLKDDNGQTPLHYAAKTEFTYRIKLLVDYGASIDILDNYGFSPYLWAVIAGQRNATDLLLSLGADVNSTSADGKSALGWAASMGHSSVTELLVGRGANIMSMTLNMQLVPLEEAAACGDLSTVRLLLNSGADPNYHDSEGWSAIHWAAEEGHCDIVLLLLEHGANVNSVSLYGTSPLHCAANGGHNNVASELLRHGADPLKATCQGWTPLHHAAFMGYPAVVQYLLKNDRVMSRPPQDNHGWSFLHLAVHRRCLDTVRVLLDSHVISKSRLQCDESGLTAEEWLDTEMDSDSYKTISNLAFSKSHCCRPVTKLRQAVYNSNIAMTEFLLEQACYVNDTDSGRRTALYYAARKGQVPILNMLLEKGADPNILPAGCRTWEEFISDDIVLQRLRQAGYTKPIPNPGIDHQIRLVLRERGETYVLDRPPLQIRLPPGSEPIGKAVQPRFSEGKVFEWLRRHWNVETTSSKVRRWL